MASTCDLLINYFPRGSAIYLTIILRARMGSERPNGLLTRIIVLVRKK